MPETERVSLLLTLQYWTLLFMGVYNWVVIPFNWEFLLLSPLLLWERGLCPSKRLTNPSKLLGQKSLFIYPTIFYVIFLEIERGLQVGLIIFFTTHKLIQTQNEIS